MKFEYIFILFMFYSVIGWICECIFVYLLSKKWINRGFLLGPYCPIYGVGAVLSLFFLKNITNAFELFILGMIICGIVEYLTSYFMELIFKARWWDYSNAKYNINGRIKLNNLILFGLGIVILFMVNSYIMNLFYKLSENSLRIIFSILFIIYIADNFVTLKSLVNINIIQNGVIKDNTVEIKEKIMEQINNTNFFNKRIIKAFPRYGINFDLIDKYTNIRQH